MKGQILICTAIMLNDHSNPYIESTTVLSDIYIPQCLGLVAEMYVFCFAWGIKVRPVLNFYFRRTIIILLLLTS